MLKKDELLSLKKDQLINKLLFSEDIRLKYKKKYFHMMDKYNRSTKVNRDLVLKNRKLTELYDAADEALSISRRGL